MTLIQARSPRESKGGVDFLLQQAGPRATVIPGSLPPAYQLGLDALVVALSTTEWPKSCLLDQTQLMQLDERRSTEVAYRWLFCFEVALARATV
jgi:hypothetical protein